MKRSFFETVRFAAKYAKYYVSHPGFVYRYSKRYSKKFSQSDLEYCVSHIYEFRLGKKLNLDRVETFNEKLAWLKCFYHDDKMTICADKVTAPAYFLEKTGLDDHYIVRNIGVYDNVDDIDFDSLPDSFVLKSNWGSAKQIIVKNKTCADSKKIKAEMASWLDYKSNHYFDLFEYGYKNIIPKIVCEEFIEFDYKIEFFCFNGKPAYFWTIFGDKTDAVCADFYDAVSLKKIDLKHGYPNSNTVIQIPKDYHDMFDIAAKLSKDFPFVRVDFYKTSNGFKFSEMTFYHWGGIMPFEPEQMNLEFGDRLVLPDKII